MPSLCQENSQQTEHIPNDEEQLEKQAISLYRHVKEISTLKYESELRREDSLIQQFGHMQAAFSFMTAAIFMATPIMMFKLEKNYPRQQQKKPSLKSRETQ